MSGSVFIYDSFQNKKMRIPRHTVNNVNSGGATGAFAQGAKMTGAQNSGGQIPLTPLWLHFCGAGDSGSKGAEVTHILWKAGGEAERTGLCQIQEPLPVPQYLTCEVADHGL